LKQQNTRPVPSLARSGNPQSARDGGDGIARVVSDGWKQRGSHATVSLKCAASASGNTKRSAST
jgi:hypothetical protein